MTELDASLERKKVRATLATRALIVGAIAMAILFGGAMLKVTLQGNEISAAIRAQQIEGTQRAKDTQHIAIDAARSATRIEDCTTPGRQCFDDGQKRTAQYLTAIDKANRRAAAAAAACADEPGTQTYEQIYQCVVARQAIQR